MRPAASAAATEAPPEYEGRVTPAVRRLAREHGIDLNLIAGTGHAGRVTREDVLGYVEQQRTGVAPASAATEGPAAAATEATTPTAPTPAFQPTQTPAATAAPAPAPQAPAAQAPAAQAPAPAAPSAPGQDELKPTTPMRKAIAAHMVQAKQTAPHAYTTVEVDMSGVVALRDAKKREYEAREGTSLSFVAIIGKAVVEALKNHRDLNAHWTDEGLLRKADINLGIAVAVDEGLIVPVIKRADEYSIHGLNLHIQDYAARARANRLKLDDIQGGTFTLNNTGWFGSVASQPIINVPEIAILSMEAIVKRPVVIETPQGDTIGIRPIMNVCVSFDHRGTDGAQVGRFVQDVRRFLETVDANTAIW
jgi:2-oxoisovalerate dehydrogenase E2 component (dihydrolipoyl transacylase)